MLKYGRKFVVVMLLYLLTTVLICFPSKLSGEDMITLIMFISGFYNGINTVNTWIVPSVDVTTSVAMDIKTENKLIGGRKFVLTILLLADIAVVSIFTDRWTSAQIVEVIVYIGGFYQGANVLGKLATYRSEIGTFIKHLAASKI